MEQEIVFGGRIFLIKCFDDESLKIFDTLYEQMLSLEPRIKELMDECNIPGQIILNLIPGDESLYGQYFVQEKDVLKEMIIIDIYTKRWLAPGNAIYEGMEVEVLDTFIHELLHNKYASEKKTKKKVKEFLSKI